MQQFVTSTSTWHYPISTINSLANMPTLLAEQVQMYYRSGTGIHCCIMPCRRYICIHQVAALFSMKWRRGCHLESVTSNQNSINWYLFTTRTILQNFMLMLLEMMQLWAFFEDGCPSNNNNNNKMSSDMRSVLDLKMNDIITLHSYSHVQYH